jgi:hypothetical protein
MSRPASTLPSDVFENLYANPNRQIRVHSRPHPKVHTLVGDMSLGCCPNEILESVGEKAFGTLSA